MTWNYQLMRHTEYDGEVWYAIHEDYRFGGYTINPANTCGETVEEVVEQLKAMLEDIEKHGVKDYE